MKFTIEKNELSYLTTLVHRAASNKNTIPVLSGLLIKASRDNGLVMTATDMEIGIKATTSRVDVIEEGSVLVNAYYFADLVKLLPDTSISIELNSETAKLNVSYGRSSGFINTYRDQEYPDLPLGELSYSFSISQDLLKEGLKKTALAAATSHFRPVFTGILFDVLDKNNLKIVASDTHRLAYYSCSLQEMKATEPFSFIIPLRTVNELLRLLDDSPEEIKVAITDNNVVFYKDDFILLSRLIEGQYPNYQQVIPGNFNTTVKLSPHILVQTLERAKTMPTDDKVKIQHVQLDFSDNEVTINTFSEAMGEIVEIIEDLNIEGDKDLKIAFNTSYFMDAVKILASENDQMIIKLSGSLGPAVLTNPEKDNYLYVLVPLRTTN